MDKIKGRVLSNKEQPCTQRKEAIESCMWQLKEVKRNINNNMVINASFIISSHYYMVAINLSCPNFFRNPILFAVYTSTFSRLCENVYNGI
jgi:hypothetical protein